MKEEDIETNKTALAALTQLPEVPFNCGWRNVYAEHAALLGYRAERGPGPSGITLYTKDGTRLAALRLEKTQRSFFVRDLILRALECYKARLEREAVARSLQTVKTPQGIAAARTSPRRPMRPNLLLAAAALGAMSLHTPSTRPTPTPEKP
jgi:hypothetical protein